MMKTSITLIIGVALGSAAITAPVAAQEVVQPLPPQAAEDLSVALGRLANDANDVDAMLDAGEAALELGDIDAAIGFFGRAKQKSPNSSRVALGLARAYTATRRPLDALRYFAEAERAGVAQARMAADRGLAYDLVGDSTTAQALYAVAIENGGNADVVRQLALSQAISGNREGFEKTLLPLLEQRDNAAFRTRAFGLAILGDTENAVRIARDMMPPNMAARIEPYLRYMTKLTPAQQAAAGNLGVFPTSNMVGRDTPDIARAKVPPPRLMPRSTAQGTAARELPPVASADRQLAPTGTPMGPQVRTPPSPAPVVVARQTVQTAEPEPSVAEAFANFGATRSRPSRNTGAVDITKIAVPREAKAPPPPPPPPPPKVPARSWVQVATGKDRDALKFDWRRISRKADGALADKGPFVTRWGQANRLLAGPYPSAKAARDMVAQLKAMGIDSFTFDSAEGETIDTLK